MSEEVRVLLHILQEIVARSTKTKQEAPQLGLVVSSWQREQSEFRDVILLDGSSRISALLRCFQQCLAGSGPSAEVERIPAGLSRDRTQVCALPYIC